VRRGAPAVGDDRHVAPLGRGSSPSVGVLVGPGVLDHLDGLHRAAARIGVAVVNTWGAKGAFSWSSPLHAGTAGLQARDFDLAGLGAVDVLVTSGLDPDEVTSRPWEGRAEVIDVEPADLGALALRWELPRRSPVPSRLYTKLAAVIGPLYADPSTPAARARQIAADLPPQGVVVATPGLAGFWIARALPTEVAGSVVVPARDAPGEVERRAAALTRGGRSVVLVTDRPTSESGPWTKVVRWDDVDLAVPDALLEVAGPIVAWGGVDA
jgi:hypothetical protein